MLLQGELCGKLEVLLRLLPQLRLLLLHLLDGACASCLLRRDLLRKLGDQAGTGIYAVLLLLNRVGALLPLLASRLRVGLPLLSSLNVLSIALGPLEAGKHLRTALKMRIGTGLCQWVLHLTHCDPPQGLFLGLRLQTLANWIR